MSIHDRLRDAATRLNASVEDAPIPPPPDRVARRWLVLVVAAIVTVAIVGGAVYTSQQSRRPAPPGTGETVPAVSTTDPTPEVSTTDASPAAATTEAPGPQLDVIPYRDSSHGFTITYPSGWHRSTEPLAPELDLTPGLEEVLSLGTYPLRPGGAECRGVAENALQDLGPDDVLVSVFLADGSDEPWPDAFGDDSLEPEPADAPYAATLCTGRSDLEVLWGFFTFEGRHVHVNVVFGDGVGDEQRRATWDVLDSFDWVADPAVGPVFGEESRVVLLFDDGIDGVLAVDPDRRIASRRVIRGQRAGDQPFRLERAGSHLVVGWNEVYSVAIDDADSSLVGRATIFVPAAEADRVWLIDYAAGFIDTRPDVSQVSLDGTPITDSVPMDLDGFPAHGVAGGLAVETEDGLVIWDVSERQATLPLGEGPSYASDAAGSLLLWCTDDCRVLRVTDVVTGEDRLSVPLDSLGLPSGFDVMAFGARTARFSPDGSSVVALAGQSVVVADVATGVVRVVAETPSPELGYHTAWSPDGSQLFVSSFSYSDVETVVLRYNMADGSVDVATLPFGGAISLVVLDRDEAGRFLSDDDQDSTSCPPVNTQPSGRSGICGFRF